MVQYGTMNINGVCTQNIHDRPNMREDLDKGSRTVRKEGSRTVPKEGTGTLSLMLKVREYLEPKPIQCSSCAGWIIFYLFCLEGISGTLLLLYYCPTVSEAYRSIQHITNTIHYGWLIRGIHIWGAHLLVISLMLHLTQKFIIQSHRRISRFTWALGILMMVLVGIFGATGYLLSWTQASYWATTFITQLSTAIPLIGEPIKILIRGGSDISQITLSRFFALHILIIPFFFSSLAGLHIVCATRSLIPRDLLFQVMVLLIIISILFSLSTFFPPHIYPKADPFNSILDIKPEWYFLASYEIFQLLRNIQPGRQSVSIILGILFHLGGFALVLLVPFFTSLLEKRKQIKFPALALLTIGLLIFLTFTILGAYS